MNRFLALKGHNIVLTGQIAETDLPAAQRIADTYGATLHAIRLGCGQLGTKIEITKSDQSEVLKDRRNIKADFEEHIRRGKTTP